MITSEKVTLDQLAVAMLKCEQTSGQTVYQHGMSVQMHVYELIYDGDLSHWKLPSWYKKVLSNLHSREIISQYTLFHDCGKSWCRTVDADGKVHFPNHAEVSKQLFLEAGGDPTIANLIGWDMCLHTCSAEEIAGLCKIWTIQDACTLLLVSLAEIHSNAKLFGGLDSISFKAKFKQIERRGNQICKFFFKENE